MQNTLPVTNENGYFEIRLESIGGMGANLSFLKCIQLFQLRF